MKAIGSISMLAGAVMLAFLTRDIRDGPALCISMVMLTFGFYLLGVDVGRTLDR